MASAPPDVARQGPSAGVLVMSSAATHFAPAGALAAVTSSADPPSPEA